MAPDLLSTPVIPMQNGAASPLIRPIMLVAVNCAPIRAWPGITPIMVSGMGAMMISGVT